MPRRIPLIAGELSSQPGGAVLVVWRSLSAIQDCWARTHRRQQDTGAEPEKYWQHGKVWDENNQPVTSDRMMILNINEFMDMNGWFLSLLNERSLRVPESPAHQQAKTIFFGWKLTHCKRATEAWGVTTDSWVDVKVARSAQDPQLQAVRHAIWQRLILGRWFSSCHMLSHVKSWPQFFWRAVFSSHCAIGWYGAELTHVNIWQRWVNHKAVENNNTSATHGWNGKNAQVSSSDQSIPSCWLGSCNLHSLH